MLNNASRVTRNNNIGRDILSNNSTSTNGDVIADSDARANHSPPADPHVIADLHRLAQLPPRVAEDRVHRVGRCVDVHAGRGEEVLADGHGGDVEDDAVVVEVHVVAKVDVAPVVHVEGGLDVDVVRAAPEELLEDLLPLVHLQRRRLVVVVARHPRGGAGLQELRVHGVVKFSGHHHVGHLAAGGNISLQKLIVRHLVVLNSL